MQVVLFVDHRIPKEVPYGLQNTHTRLLTEKGESSYTHEAFCKQKGINGMKNVWSL